MRDIREIFAENRRLYAERVPELIAEYEKSGRLGLDPYIKDWLPEFSPIENMVWQDIRGMDVPMYPQVPALQFFLDFACPIKKIAVECDGKEWHSVEKDAIRDEKLRQIGWTIYRIPGWKCNRILPSPYEYKLDLEQKGFCDEYIDPRLDEYAREWFVNTSTGIIRAINQRHFGADAPEFPDYSDETLERHESRAVE